LRTKFHGEPAIINTKAKKERIVMKKFIKGMIAWTLVLVLLPIQHIAYGLRVSALETESPRAAEAIQTWTSCVLSEKTVLSTDTLITGIVTLSRGAYLDIQGGLVMIEKDAQISGDLFVTGDDVTIINRGRIMGDVEITGARVQFENDGAIEGTVSIDGTRFLEGKSGDIDPQEIDARVIFQNHDGAYCAKIIPNGFGQVFLDGSVGTLDIQENNYMDIQHHSNDRAQINKVYYRGKVFTYLTNVAIDALYNYNTY